MNVWQIIMIAWIGGSVILSIFRSGKPIGNYKPEDTLLTALLLVVILAEGGFFK